MKLLRTPRVWQIALTCYWVGLFVGTHVPMEAVPPRVTTVDKLAHLAAFAVLSILFATTWQLSAGRLNPRHLTRAWIVIALYGAFEEATQPLVGRNASILDWLADALGAILGLLVFGWMRRKMMRDLGVEPQ